VRWPKRPCPDFAASSHTTAADAVASSSAEPERASGARRANVLALVCRAPNRGQPPVPPVSDVAAGEAGKRGSSRSESSSSSVAA